MARLAWYSYFDLCSCMICIAMWLLYIKYSQVTAEKFVSVKNNFRLDDQIAATVHHNSEVIQV